VEHLKLERLRPIQQLAEKAGSAIMRIRKMKGVPKSKIKLPDILKGFGKLKLGKEK
jgi:hypothetical protein